MELSFNKDLERQNQWKYYSTENEELKDWMHREISMFIRNMKCRINDIVNLLMIELLN